MYLKPYFQINTYAHMQIDGIDVGVYIPIRFLCGTDGEESAHNAGDPSLIPGLRRSPGEGTGYPLQYSCLGNPMDRGAWRATVHGSQRVRHSLATDKQPHHQLIK